MGRFKNYELKPDLVPPRGAVPSGVHTDGRTIFKLERYSLSKSLATKRQKLDEKGKPEFKKHPTTGEKVYPIMVRDAVTEEIEFVLQRSPRGKVSLLQDFREREEDVVIREARVRTDAFNTELTRLAVERGVSPESVINTIMQQTDANAEAALPYPHHRGGGHWRLSNNTTVRGTKEEAEVAEAVLHVDPSAPAEELSGDEL